MLWTPYYPKFSNFITWNFTICEKYTKYAFYLLLYGNAKNNQMQKDILILSKMVALQKRFIWCWNPQNIGEEAEKYFPGTARFTRCWTKQKM